MTNEEDLEALRTRLKHDEQVCEVIDELIKLRHWRDVVFDLHPDVDIDINYDINNGDQE